MIGCILTGHGEFATGLSHSLTMIAGEQTNFEVVPFKEELPLKEFEETLSYQLTKLLKVTKGVVIFCDLLGGTPFNTAMVQSLHLENVAVIAGTNLPLLIEGSLLRLTAEDASQLANHLVTVGRESLLVAQVPKFEGNIAEDLIEEGI
ncbi:PTS sugar transporter subunit IIA [Vagococcus salmoninarum]|uniref:PTS EIIA type-4 domain-containing protein n=1 Tax=Vagococcus salmoninarum TaxID=2739 RepID=A0A429ZDV9_9ENTE|nr:PTS sugar transporter subunit IIA [Vagococcus salmoninarum]RST91882.1 hypothetical protein CBF35_13680 [Vagococcus salmoninarum]